MTRGERFTLGLLASAQATIFAMSAEIEGAWDMVAVLVTWTALSIMGLVMLVSSGTKPQP
jgi:hypothetical protein